MLPGPTNAQSFYSFVREESLFCTTLAHLLMQKGPNLGRFLDLVSSKLPGFPSVPSIQLERAEIYLEFTLLRDSWELLGKDNEGKRRRIFDYLSRVPGLRHYKSKCFPDTIPEFNKYFMGSRGAKIVSDISYPGQWSVEVLREKFKNSPEEFRDWCRFKWSFNIRPDMVVLLPGARPFCIEAKLESPEGRYPQQSSERDIFDDVFGKGKGRVGQIELQRFMFAHHLEDLCQNILIGKKPPSSNNDGILLFLPWKDVFRELNLDSSIPFVRNLVEENRHL